MFKEFWESKKLTIEITGLFTGVGAIFLAIPLPEHNELAKNALLNIQIFWLLLISILAATLFISFWTLALSVEKRAKDKHVDIEGGLTGLIFVVVFWFLRNWWVYINTLYQQSLHDFLISLQYPVSIFILSVPLYLRRRLSAYFIDKKIGVHFLFGSTLVTSILYGALNATWYELIGFNFNIKHWFEIFKYSTLIILIIDNLLILRLIKRENILKKIDKMLKDKFLWAVSGSVAVSIHQGSYHRGHRHISIVISDPLLNIKKIFKKIKINDKKDMGELTLRGMPILFYFLDSTNNFQYNNKIIHVDTIEQKSFYDASFPVLKLGPLKELQSLQKYWLKEELDKETNSDKIKKIEAYIKDTEDDLKNIEDLSKSSQNLLKYTMPKEILDYLNSQRVGVLAVEMVDGFPHAATVHFAYDQNSGLFLFETDKRYRKSEPLFSKETTRASFVIGFEETNTKTLQLDGVAQLVKTETEKEFFEKVYYGKFPEKIEKAKSLGDNWVSFSFKPTWWRFTVWTEDKGKVIISSEDNK